MAIRSTAPLILASASPRREELLRLLGLPFTTVPSETDETQRSAESPRDHALRLAGAKAASVSAAHPESWVMGADTIVLQDGRILGKPAHQTEATCMLQALSGRSHTVITGYAVARSGRILERDAVSSLVWFREIAPDELAWYVATNEPYDKAGAYAAQGRGACFIRAIQGSYTNVVGLPLCEVVDALKRLGALAFSGEGNHVHRR